MPFKSILNVARGLIGMGGKRRGAKGRVTKRRRRGRR